MPVVPIVVFVKAGFWVLHRSACPSVLIELGFISNPAEERFLASDKGQKELATSVCFCKVQT